MSGSRILSARSPHSDAEMRWAAMPSDSAIEIRHLSKSFGETRAVIDVTFDVRNGEVFGFMGHNGAGKTTTLRMLLGLLRPTGGSARVSLAHSAIRCHRVRGP